MEGIAQYTVVLVFLLIGCSSGTKQSEKSQVIEVETNRRLNTELLYNTWAHRNRDANPVFRIDPNSFDIFYNSDVPKEFEYRVEGDSIEIFEYHEGQTSKGQILRLSRDSLEIGWSTGDKNEYVSWKQ